MGVHTGSVMCYMKADRVLCVVVDWRIDLVGGEMSQEPVSSQW